MTGKSFSKRLAALLIVMCLALSAAACGSKNDVPKETGAQSSTEEKTTAASKAEKEPVTLTVLWHLNFSGTPGIQTTPVAEELKKATGITLDIISDDGEFKKLKLYLASGDLPDIAMAPKEMAKQVIEGGNAIALNDLLKTNGKDVLANCQTALDAVNLTLGNNDGKYYYIPYEVNPSPAPFLGLRPWIGLFTRWDYYKELGYPEIKTLDEFIGMLAQMQKNHPKTSDGKKIYGISGFADWGNWGYYVPFMYSMGYTEVTNAVFTPEKKVIYRFDAEGPYWKGIEFLYKARKAGVLDPDAFTMKYDNYVEKAKNGQIIAVGAGWIADEANVSIAAKEGADKGYQSIPLSVFNTSWAHNNSRSKAGYWDGLSFITKSCKKPERAMDLLNFTHTYEGSRLLINGIEGKDWKIENGKPELTDETYKARKEDKDYNLKTGANALYLKLIGIDGAAVNPKDNAYVDLARSKKGLMQTITELDKDFSKHYGASFPGEAWDKLVKEGKAKLPVQNIYYSAFAPAETDEIKKIHTSIDEYLKKNFSKCILAKSDEDFQKEMQRQIDELNKLGLSSMRAWYEKQISEADALYNRLGK